MTAGRHALVLVAALAIVGITAPGAGARSVGQVIDDTAITTEIKAKLTADKLSNLTKIEVRTDHGIVTLNGVVDDAARRARAAQIASGVGGVKGLVNNIHVAGTTIPPSGPPAATGAALPGPGVDATGVVASIDHATGTITLQDGRVVRLTDRTVIWQPTTVRSLRPGAQVFVREAAPVVVQPPTAAAAPEWRMGTVRAVDRAAHQIILTDGTVVRVAPSAVLRRGADRLAIEQIVPGSEIVVRTASRVGPAEGSALPGQAVATPVDATEINVVWTPVSGVR